MKKSNTLTGLLLSCGLLLLCPPGGYAQNGEWTKKDEQKLEKARELEGNQYLEEAIEAYQEVLAHNKDNVEIKLTIAGIYFRLHNQEEAIHWYGEALDKSLQAPVPFDAIHLYNYASLLQEVGEQNEALYWYRAYQLNRPEDTRSARKIEGINKIGGWKEKAADYKVKEAPFNSPYADFSPAFYEDGVVFVSGRGEEQAGNGDDTPGATYLDLYYSTLSDGDGAEPEKFSAVINSSLHEGPAVFYDHNSKMIFTRNNTDTRMKRTEERQVIHLQLYYAERDSASRAWKQPVLLSINNPSYSVAHPAISRDGTRLYLASDMPGGYGGTDLYVSEWQNGTWTAPQNLGDAINTEGNEMFPFLYADTLLYFASDGQPGMGGLDIQHVAIGKSDVVNAGYPINSTRDDFGFILAEAGGVGYFASDRTRSRTGQHGDIYRVDIIRDMPPPPPVEVPVEEQVAVALPDTLITEVYYTVQILALKNSKTVEKKFLQDLSGVLKYDGKDGFHRYTYGTYKTLEEAVEELERIRAKGYQDAFVRREERYKDLSKRPGITIYP